jgi:predicted SprT family Zn-dependent metalloprotease
MNDRDRNGHLGSLLRQWASLWRVSDLADVRVCFSHRLKRSAGRCQPALNRVVLQVHLCADPDVLAEVLCHEMAHIAAHRLFGSHVSAHGAEWQSLVLAAGYEPRVNAPFRAHPARSYTTRANYLFEHRCPVCQMLKAARKPMRTWRCAMCLATGLDGVLLIEKRAGRFRRGNV